MLSRKLLALCAIPALTACGPRPPSLEDLRAAGYRELEEGRLEEARAAAERGRSYARQQHQAAWVRTFAVLEAEVRFSQGRNAEALALLEPGLAAQTSGDRVRVRGLMTRGAVLCRLPEEANHAARAAADFDLAARTAEALGSAELTAEVMQRRGSCHFRERQYPEAEADFRATLAAAGRENLKLLQAHAAGSIGLVHVQTERYDDALEWLLRAQALAAAPGAEVAQVKVMINLAWCYYLLGDYERAVPLLTEAVEITATKGLTGDREIALRNLGNTSYKLGQYGRATTHYLSALAIARELKNRAEAATLLTNLGAVALEQERYDDAESYVGQALPITTELEDEPSRQLCLFAEADIAAGRGERERAEALYRGLLASPLVPSEWRWEVHASLARAYARAGRSSAARTEFDRGFASIEGTRSSLHDLEHRITFFSSLRRFQDDYVDFLVSSGQPEQALLVAERSHGRALRERLGNQDPALGAVASIERFQRLARRLDAVLLAYWVAPRRSFLWVVRPDRVEVRVLPDATSLRRDVEAYQSDILASRDPLAEKTSAGLRLWRNLAEPVAALGAGARVIVIPDGPLYQLDFGTLIVPGAEPRYWIEDVTLAEAPSLTLLSEPGPRSHPSSKRILVIGDPIPASDAFPRLPHASRELERIAALFDGDHRVLFSGAAAQPSCYTKAEPGGFDLIHFASHVNANHEIALESGIVLSPAGDTYKLLARDVMSVPLRAELVTLSACHSAGSRTYAGEGLVGLAWAFLGAGAANVVGGLWNVEDASTARLMEDLYRGIQEGRDPAAALRDAQLALLRSENAFRKPFYWAPFVVCTRGALPSAARTRNTLSPPAVESRRSQASRERG